MRNLVRDSGVRGGGRLVVVVVRSSVTRLALVAMALIPVVLFTVALGAAPASAHAELASSSPEDGSDVATLPATVELTFSEAVGSTSVFVVVSDPGGEHVEVGRPEVVDGTVTQATTGGGPAGEYTLAYRVISADGHPISGEVGFTVSAASEAQRAADPSTVAPPDATADGTDSDEGFVSRHATHLGLGAVGLIAAGVLLGVGVRGRHDISD